MPSPSLDLPAPLLRARTIPLVGRVEELGRLTRLWRDATASGGGTIIVSGDAGVGKTRLISELGLVAQGDDGLVVFGRCDEEALTPYQPFRQILSAVLQARPDVRAALPAHVCAAVAHLVPELRSVLPGAPEPEDRFVLFEATSALLRAVAERQHLLVVVDDVQWADQPSWQLLRHIAIHPTAAPVVIAGTARVESTSTRTLVDQLEADVERAGRTARNIELVGLQPSELPDLAVSVDSSIERAQIDEAMTAALYTATQGNPFFVRETVRHLIETGSLLAGRVLAVPGTVRAVVERRLKTLDPDCRSALETAAVAGHEFPLSLVAAVRSTSPALVMTTLDQAIDARLVSETEQREILAFAHPVIRQTIEGSVTPSRKAFLHAAIADHLEREQAPNGEHLIPIAFHLNAAGAVVPVGRLHRSAVAAAEHAMRMVAYEDATRLFGIALDTADAARATPRERIDLRIGLGDAMVQSGDKQGRDALATAGREAQQHGTPEQVARAVFAASQESVAIAYDDPTFITMLEDALIAVGSDDSALRARVMGRLGFELFQHDTGDRPTRLIDEAVEVARRVGDPAALAVVLGHRRFYRYGPEEALADGVEIVKLAEQAGEPAAAFPGLVSQASAALQRGDVSAAAGMVDLIERRARELRRARMQWWAAHARGTLAGIAGDLDESDRLLGVALDLGQRTGEANAFGFYLSQAFPNAMFRGILGLMADPLRDYVVTTPGSTLAAAAQALVFAEAGATDEAAVVLESFARDRFASIRRDSTYPAGLAALAEASVRLGDRKRALELRGLLVPMRGTVIDISAMSGCYGPLDRVLGGLAACVDDYDGAVDHLEAATRLAERMASPPWLKLSRLELAAALESRGGPHDAERVNNLRELVDLDQGSQIAEASPQTGR